MLIAFQQQLHFNKLYTISIINLDYYAYIKFEMTALSKKIPQFKSNVKLLIKTGTYECILLSKQALGYAFMFRIINLFNIL